MATASAQLFQGSRTVRLNDDKGEQVGTATITGRNWVLRDSNHELIGTVTVDADGGRTLYDPDGKLIKRIEPK